jgi:hypothetical protein
MNRTEHIATTAAEECNEVAQRISKALRFGWQEVQPGQPLNNGERIVQEFHDLFTMLDWLMREGMIDERLSLVPNPEIARAKREKVEKFMAISRDQGALS